ncbi:hypothetical protein [Cytobacillus sp. NCCP-133]|uniref:hypothetical protein n=1 Tax=Cytobacillus sp. NCCP-133 TaxID=766848 RepID=UPI0022306C9F|nr:hypothetical protein [Cytobacillus sp. NCCP-133]GLB58657.1 hypothetical protein NCCP133_07900 [Cytobacillus sp. NCCP-133]
MMNRKSYYTLIELIVVLVVLELLKEIKIPEIEIFEGSREQQLNADAHNMQEAVRLYRAKSDKQNMRVALRKYFRL